MNKPPIIQLTTEGYTAFKKRHAQLQLERKEAVSELKRAREMGDLSENGLYKASRMKLSSIDHEVRQLNMLLKYATIIEPSSSNCISIGSKVVLEQSGIAVTYTLVGEYEANPHENRISTKSPLGSKLLGKCMGQSVVIHTPRGKTIYEVKHIS